MASWAALPFQADPAEPIDPEPYGTNGNGVTIQLLLLNGETMLPRMYWRVVQCVTNNSLTHVEQEQSSTL